MLVELKKDMRTSLEEKLVEFPQWQVHVDGKCVGYLPHAVDSELLPVIGFPMDRLDHVISECQRQRKEMDGKESIVRPPSEQNTRFLQIYEIVKAQEEADAN